MKTDLLLRAGLLGHTICKLQPSVYPLYGSILALVPNSPKDLYCVSCLVSAF